MMMKINKYKRTIALWSFILIGAGAGYSSLFHQKPTNQTPVEAPEKQSTVTTTAQEVSVMPPAPQSPTTQKIQQWTTPGGTKVYLIGSHSIPMVDIHISFDAGSARDGTQFGLANCWLSLLDQGTSSLNADQIAEQFENKGAILNTRVDRDRAMISLRSLSDPQILNPLLNVLADLIAKPALKEESIVLIKNQILTEQKMMQQPAILSQQKSYLKHVHQS
jgi:predicted Zn-dependent peptidase